MQTWEATTCAVQVQMGIRLQAVCWMLRAEGTAEKLVQGACGLVRTISTSTPLLRFEASNNLEVLSLGKHCAPPDRALSAEPGPRTLEQWAGAYELMVQVSWLAGCP